MVEMLVVLAIIGVLSVGGVLGYSRAIASKRANDIIEYLSVLSVNAAERNKQGTYKCSKFEAENVTAPEVFTDCELTFTRDRGITINVTYSEENISELLISALETKNSSYIYVNENATQFCLGGCLEEESGEEGSGGTSGGGSTADSSCSAYNLTSEQCEAGHMVCTPCPQNGTKFKKDGCDKEGGYYNINGTCVQACRNYPLNECPEHGQCRYCAEDDSKVSLRSCDSGFEPNAELTECNSVCAVHRQVNECVCKGLILNVSYGS